VLLTQITAYGTPEVKTFTTAHSAVKDDNRAYDDFFRENWQLTGTQDDIVL